MLGWTPNASPTGGAVNVGCRWTKCTEFVTAGWCIGKQQRLSQTIRNLTCGDFGNIASVDSTGSTLTEKDLVRVPPGLVGGRWEKEWCDLVCVSEAPLVFKETQQLVLEFKKRIQRRIQKLVKHL